MATIIISDLKSVDKNLKINTAWVPINGYAQDYPFCYDNISINEKKKLFKQ